MTKKVPSAWRISLWPGPEPFRNVLPRETHDMEVDMESYPTSVMGTGATWGSRSDGLRQKNEVQIPDFGHIGRIYHLLFSHV